MACGIGSSNRVGIRLYHVRRRRRLRAWQNLALPLAEFVRFIGYNVCMLVLRYVHGRNNA